MLVWQVVDTQELSFALQWSTRIIILRQTIVCAFLHSLLTQFQTPHIFWAIFDSFLGVKWNLCSLIKSILSLWGRHGYIFQALSASPRNVFVLFHFKGILKKGLNFKLSIKGRLANACNFNILVWNNNFEADTSCIQLTKWERKKSFGVWDWGNGKTVKFFETDYCFKVVNHCHLEVIKSYQFT